jgi:hypothetical protein
MALIGWILSLACLLGGLAMRQDMPIGGSDALANMLFGLAVLTCPMLWRDSPLGISRGQRIAAGLALVLAVPMIILPA